MLCKLNAERTRVQSVAEYHDITWHRGSRLFVYPIQTDVYIDGKRVTIDLGPTDTRIMFFNQTFVDEITTPK